jgi:ABC-type branched-subunit amino acid transport system permease subunit
MNRRAVLWLAAGVVALVALPWLVGGSTLRLATELIYFSLFAISLNLLVGYGGLPSFGHGATFGVAAYATAIVAGRWPELPLALLIPLALAAGAAAGLAIGVVAVRVHGGYFALLTLALCQLLEVTANRWRSVTLGDDGMSVRMVGTLDLFGVRLLDLNDPRTLYFFVLVTALACAALCWRFTRAPLGLAVVLARENAQRAAVLGYDVFLTRLLLFVFAGTVAAMAGILFALVQRHVSPQVFGLALSAEVLFMVIIGGTAYFLGPVLGALCYLLLQHWLSGFTSSWALVIGVLFVLLVLFAPLGIVDAGRRIGLRLRPVPEGGR